jgi:hypothetical protein
MQATSGADGSVTVAREQSLPRFITGITVDFLQPAGTELSVHIWLYMGSRNSLPVGEDERVFPYGYQRGQRMCCSSTVMLQEVFPC